MLKFWDFIEIGTCDFDTEIQKNDNKIGISVEPLEYYLEKLPTKPGCIKVNSAVSNYTGKLRMHYIPEETIRKNYLPLWVKGCNSVNKRHVNVRSILKQHCLDINALTVSCEVNCTTLLDLMEQYYTYGLYYLKIDTEGHDLVILDHFLKNVKNNSFLPHKILFESNNLISVKEKRKVLMLAAEKGYVVEYSSKDTLLKLNLNKLQNKSMFSEKIKNYVIKRCPPNYNVQSLPHENNLESAQRYCIKNNFSGVVYTKGTYEVRCGNFLFYDDEQECCSWIFL